MSPRQQRSDTPIVMTTIVIACGCGARRDGSCRHRLRARTPVARGDGRRAVRGRRRSSTSGWRRWCATSPRRSSAPRRRTGAPASLGELGGTIDLDEVLARTLDGSRRARRRRRRGDLDRRRGRRAAGRGRRSRAGEPPATISGPPDGRSPRMIAVEYDYGRSDEAVEGGPIRAALAVPLLSDGEQLGYLTAYSRSGTSGVRRGECGRARGARAPGRPGDRQRAPLPRGAPARRPRRADGPAQPALLPRDARSARSRAHSATAATSRSSSSTSTTSRRSTTGSATSPATPSSPRRPSASATSSARPTSPAASAATSSR